MCPWSPGVGHPATFSDFREQLLRQPVVIRRAGYFPMQTILVDTVMLIGCLLASGVIAAMCGLGLLVWLAGSLPLRDR
jgi:hypothetical protein